MFTSFSSMSLSFCSFCSSLHNVYSVIFLCTCLLPINKFSLMFLTFFLLL
jgi:hypothetical protein